MQITNEYQSPLTVAQMTMISVKSKTSLNWISFLLYIGSYWSGTHEMQDKVIGFACCSIQFFLDEDCLFVLKSLNILES